jgi:hypothetical protein
MAASWGRPKGQGVGGPGGKPAGAVVEGRVIDMAAMVRLHWRGG